MEAALVKHHIAFYKHVAATDPKWIDDVWGSARYSEVLVRVFDLGPSTSLGSSLV